MIITGAAGFVARALLRRFPRARDTFACVTWIEHLADRAAEIIRSGARGVINAANEGVCSPEEFAREAARVVGADSWLIEPVSEPGRLRPRSTPLVTDPP